eukprot:2744346-Pyramimonas_sp.AAC.1
MLCMCGVYSEGSVSSDYEVFLELVRYARLVQSCVGREHDRRYRDDATTNDDGHEFTRGVQGVRAGEGEPGPGNVQMVHARHGGCMCEPPQTQARLNDHNNET